jgi:hypothetical protein
MTRSSSSAPANIESSSRSALRRTDNASSSCGVRSGVDVHPDALRSRVGQERPHASEDGRCALAPRVRGFGLSLAGRVPVLKHGPDKRDDAADDCAAERRAGRDELVRRIGGDG